jgi:hypothetical protein
MRAHLNTEDLHVMACHVINKIISTRNCNATEAARMGLMTDLHAAMRAHLRSEPLHALACHAIRHENVNQEWKDET